MPDLSSLTPAQWYLLLGSVFVFGLCWGSFLNVVIHRLPRRESVVRPRSRCPGCGCPIPWYRNIPLLSWAALRARCADCGMRISWRYPLVELLTALLFTAAAAFSRGSPLAWPFHFWFLGALVACTFIDIDHWILPDRITLPGIAVGFLGAVAGAGPGPGWLASLGGILLGGGILYLVAWAYRAFAHKDGLGGGDIKFLAMIGAFLGPQGALTTLVLASLLGSLAGVFLILWKGKKGGTAIQFGPFLCLGALTAFFFGGPLWQWYFGMR